MTRKTAVRAHARERRVLLRKRAAIEGRMSGWVWVWVECGREEEGTPRHKHHDKVSARKRMCE